MCTFELAIYVEIATDKRATWRSFEDSVTKAAIRTYMPWRSSEFLVVMSERWRDGWSLCLLVISAYVYYVLYSGDVVLIMPTENSDGTNNMGKLGVSIWRRINTVYWTNMTLNGEHCSCSHHPFLVSDVHCCVLFVSGGEFESHKQTTRLRDPTQTQTHCVCLN